MMAVSSKLWLIGFGVLGVAAITAITAVLLLRDRDTPAPASTPSLAASAEPTTTSAARPTGASSPAIVNVPVPDISPYISETPGAWTRDEFPGGVTPDVRRGLYFLNATTGSTERFTIVTDTPDRDLDHSLLAYSMSDDDAWLFAQDGDLFRVFNRVTGRSWGWTDANLIMYNARANRLVLENRIFDNRTSGPVIVMDGDMHVAGRCDVGPAYSRKALLSNDGTRLVIVSQLSPPDPNALLGVQDEKAVLCDVASGQITALPAAPAAPAGEIYTGVTIAIGPTASGITAIYDYQQAPGSSAETRKRIYRLLSWDGAILHEFALPPDVAPDISPDGTLMAWPDELVETPGEGATAWGFTIIADATTGQPFFRIRGAWLSSGIRLQGTHWLADSSGIVVMTAGDPADPGADGTPKSFGYQVVSRDGSSHRWLPFSSDDRFAGVLPSPTDPNVFALGRNTVVNLASGRSVSVDFPETETSDFFGAWDAAGDELRFASPLLGHGISFPMLVSSLRIERPPFDDNFRFVVARTGSCLNIHDAPSRTAPVTNCLNDGTAVTRTVAPFDSQPNPIGAIVIGPDRWVHVATAEGKAGWASASYLDIAP